MEKNNGNLFANLTKTQRFYLYYFVCILVRTLIVYFLYYYSEKFILVIIGLAIYSVYYLQKNLESNPDIWWSRKFHLMNAILILITSICVYFKKFTKVDPRLISLIFAFDLYSGVMYSLVVKPFM